MNEPKWTMPPWHFDVNWGAVVSDVIVDNDSGTDIICTFDEADALDAEIDANGRLIAAAPDLASGCSAILGLIDLILSRSDLSDDLRFAISNSHRITEAKRALAKALGEPVTDPQQMLVERGVG